MSYIFLSFFILLNIVLVFYNKSIANLFNLFDKPDNVRKFHKLSVPITGGIIIYVNLIFFSILQFFINYDLQLFESFQNYLIFFGVCSLFFFLGLIDDKILMNANLKFLLIIFFIILALFLDNQIIIKQVRLFFISFEIPLWSIPWTLICFLLFINAFNMFDGYNLQCSSYSIFLLSILYLKSNLSNIFLILIISIIFFSFLNYKSKSFMGDSGTYLLAFIISYFSIKLYNSNNFVNVEEIVLLMIIPGIDLMRLFIERIFILKKSAFAPDRNHLHHYLLKKNNLNQTFFITNAIIILPYLIGLYFSIMFYMVFVQIIIYFIVLKLLKD